MEEADRTPQSDDQMKTSGRGLESTASFTVAIQPQQQETTYLLIQSQHEKVGNNFLEECAAKVIQQHLILLFSLSRSSGNSLIYIFATCGL